MAAHTGKAIKKAIVYKQAVFHTALPAGQTLRSLLEGALGSTPDKSDRSQDAGGPDDPYILTIARSRVDTSPRGFIFGMFSGFRPGEPAFYLVDEDQSKDYGLEAWRPQEEDGKSRELRQAELYFAVISNHVALIQSQGLKASQFERYLQVFLHKTNVLPGDNTLSLRDITPDEISASLAGCGGVKEIVLGGEVVQPTVASEADDPPARNLTTRRGSTALNVAHTPGGRRLLESLKALLPTSAAADIDFDQLSGSNIEMKVVLTYNRKTTETGQKLIDNLAGVLRNVDGEVDAEIRFNNGDVIKGEDFKLKGKISLTSYDGQLSEDGVYEGMREWLLRKVQNGDVQGT